MAEIKCEVPKLNQGSRIENPKEIAKVLADGSPADIACIVRKTAFSVDISAYLENPSPGDRAKQIFTEVARINPEKAADAAIIIAKNARGEPLQEILVPQIVLESESISAKPFSSEFSFRSAPNPLTTALFKRDPDQTTQLLTARARAATPALREPTFDGEREFWQAQVNDAVKKRVGELARLGQSRNEGSVK